MEVVFYVASDEDFFITPCCIDCNMVEYCAFTDANRILEVDRVHEKKMINIGKGIYISEPVVVAEGNREADKYLYASISHQGILALSSTKNILYYNTSKYGKGLGFIQFVNVLNKSQVVIDGNYDSSVAFYDDKMILLTRNRPLREASVKDVFEFPEISTFKAIEGTGNVNPDTDVSRLQSRRVLFYSSTNLITCEYNVDTKENTRVHTGKKVLKISSLMGLDCGVRGVFHDYLDDFAYAFGWDGKVTLLYSGKESVCLNSIFLSSRHPKDLSGAVLKYSNYFIKEGRATIFRRPVLLGTGRSVVRIYRDIFLVYNCNDSVWCLCRIIVS